MPLEGSSSDSAAQTHGEVAGRVEVQKGGEKKNTSNSQAKNTADVVPCSACA